MNMGLDWLTVNQYEWRDDEINFDGCAFQSMYDKLKLT